MIEIRCLDDIISVEEKQALPKRLIALLTDDLHTIQDYVDECEEYSFEEFNTDYMDNGYIAVLEGNESRSDIVDTLGLTGGLDDVIPETAENYTIDGDKWTRIVVVYNDSYSMIIWLKNYDGFDSYAIEQKSYCLFNDKQAPF